MSGSRGVVPSVATFEVDAILFDMDGTLVDSADSILETWNDFAKRHGLDQALVHATLPGRTAHDIVQELLPAATHDEHAIELAWIRKREQITRSGVDPITGATALLASLAESRWAVVTAASAVMMRTRLRAAGLPLPRHSVTADDDIPGKPAPDGYLRAASLVTADPRRCAVVEDSTAGLVAGRRAGCICIAVGDADGPADARVPDLSWVSATATSTGTQIRSRIHP